MDNSAYRHITFFKFKPEVTPEEKEVYEKDTREMLANFSSVMKNVQFGKNEVQSGYEYIINGEFNSLEDRQKYLDHEIHKALLTKWADKWESRVSGVLQVKF
jgi:hypothetical protein